MKRMTMNVLNQIMKIKQWTKNDEDKVEGKGTNQEPAIDEQAKDDQIGVLASKTHKEKLTLFESTDAEITSMVDVQIQQEILSELSAHLLDVLAFVVPPTPTTSTPPPILTTTITTTEAPTSTSKQALFDSMHESTSLNKHPANKTLYHALMESLIADENAMDQGVADLIKHKKRPHDDDDRDQDHHAGPD
ncbi:hypothetical protein Tco_0875869 [Tanacetum coccineum]|uniref:Uncharacterized protein n=1 Tax=Tanacetum coccineum TaxID=301880 RepID=A0ABQ5BU61_9ASTR